MAQLWQSCTNGLAFAQNPRASRCNPGLEGRKEGIPSSDYPELGDP